MPRADQPDWTRRPAPDEYGEFYREYVGLVPDGDLLATLEREGRSFSDLILSVPPDREDHRYAPDKWSIREIVGHVIDAERVNALRALWFARAAVTAQPGWEENDWARVSNAGRRPMRDLADEWQTVRRSSIQLLESFDADALERRGTANGVSFTTRAMAWVVAGHALHHKSLLQDRYLK